MSNIYRQAVKTVNTYVEIYEGDWKEVRRCILRDVDFLFQEGTDGAKLYALALDHAFHEMKPELAP